MRLRTIAIALLVSASTLLGQVAFLSCSQIDDRDPSNPRAAIINQLSIRYPNQAFIEEITQYLEDCGYAVDTFQGEAVTVDLYRKLPQRQYKLILFRVHSGLLGVDPKVTEKTWLFTAEPYSELKYVTEQLTDQITYAKTREEYPWLFAVSAKFITDSLDGEFDNTVIIMMGCDGLNFDDLAQAFVDRGASAYVAWDSSVGINYVDGATTALIEQLCSKELTLRAAVTETMKEKGPDPKYGAALKYYPPASAEKTLKQLIN
ncbi:hypothetical protein ACFLX4_03010 [Chloroflexota bacterium]